MKTALAIFFSLMIAGAQVVPAQPSPAASTGPALPVCCKSHQASCCSARPVTESQPASATPVPSSQNQLLPLAPAALAWTLPDVPSSELSSFLFSPSVSAGAPLYQRDCARLI
jgi:hypothetical protein